MQTQTAEKGRRIKKRVAEMYPVKKWLSLDEACAFMDMSANPFQDMVRDYGLTVSTLPPFGGSKRSNKKYYLVSELENIINENILIRKIEQPAQLRKA